MASENYGDEGKGSEEIIEMHCELCKKKGKDRRAEGFCVNCVKYFCVDCLGYHTEFLPDHVHKDKANMPQDVCLIPCANHSTQIIKFYCSTCNKFFCSECKKIGHKECKDIRHLPELVKDLEKGAEYLELKQKLEAIEKESKDVLTDVHMSKKTVETSSRKAMSEIELLRDRLIEWVHSNIISMQSDLKSVEETEMEQIQDKCSKLSGVVSETSAMKSAMEQKIQESKRCELFMSMKEFQTKQKSLQDDLLQVKSHRLKTFHYEINSEIQSLIEKPINFGNITCRYNYTSSPVEEVQAVQTKKSPVANKLLQLGPVREIPDVHTQKSFVANQLQKPLNVGDTWYIIDIKWFKQWKSYVGYESWDHFNVGEESAHPGPIDNMPILQEGTNKLKEHLIDDLDYGLVPEECWNTLTGWYGLKNGQEDHLARRVIEEGVYSKSLTIEVYPWHLNLCEISKLDDTLKKEFSRSDTIGKLEEVMRREFSIPRDEEVRLWIRYMTNMYEQLKEKEKTLQDAEVYQGQVIVIEQRNPDGTWSRSS